MKIIKNNELRLRPVQLPEDLIIALPWYQDKEVLYFSEGAGTLPYDIKTIDKMYSYLSQIGELYIIEIYHNKKWLPIGDVTLSKEMIPIVIGPKAFRAKGIGMRIISLLIERAKTLEWDKMKVNKIYSYNTASRRMFESLGFSKTDTKFDDKGREYSSFALVLAKNLS
ncbi:GNAT family N-acetyltransferase [Bacillus sp. SCS-151]|uniref:GNAT family N-acetyltransferase n=1 Tax=Nanhaiella sioensis TaxID=3115293 RepID=UPI003979FBE1